MRVVQAHQDYQPRVNNSHCGTAALSGYFFYKYKLRIPDTVSMYQQSTSVIWANKLHPAPSPPPPPTSHPKKLPAYADGFGLSDNATLLFSILSCTTRGWTYQQTNIVLKLSQQFSEELIFLK